MSRKTKPPEPPVPDPAPFHPHLIPPEYVRPSPTNPRRHFDKAGLERLAASLRRHGMLQNLLVRPLPGNGKFSPVFEVVLGERRLRAAMMAGMSAVPCTVLDLTDEQAAAIQADETTACE